MRGQKLPACTVVLCKVKVCTIKEQKLEPDPGILPPRSKLKPLIELSIVSRTCLNTLTPRDPLGVLTQPTKRRQLDSEIRLWPSVNFAE
jgi:hypothetical protein